MGAVARYKLTRRKFLTATGTIFLGLLLPALPELPSAWSGYRVDVTIDQGKLREAISVGQAQRVGHQLYARVSLNEPAMKRAVDVKITDGERAMWAGTLLDWENDPDIELDVTKDQIEV